MVTRQWLASPAADLPPTRCGHDCSRLFTICQICKGKQTRSQPVAAGPRAFHLVQRLSERRYFVVQVQALIADRLPLSIQLVISLLIDR
jgi:hypothetical protein